MTPAASRNSSCIACLALLLFSLSCEHAARSAATGPLTDTDRAAIRSIDSSFVAAWLRDDTTSVLDVFAPDAVLLPPGSAPISGRDAIRGYWWPADGSHTKITAFDRRIDEIAGNRGLAFLRGTARLAWVYEKDGKRSSQGSHSQDFLVFAPDSAGHWRVIRQMWSTLPG